MIRNVESEPMAQLPNEIEVEDREYAATEVVELVLESTARELAACMDAIKARRERVGDREEPTAFGVGLAEAVRVLRHRAHELGIPHRVDKDITKPLDSL